MQVYNWKKEIIKREGKYLEYKAGRIDFETKK